MEPLPYNRIVAVAMRDREFREQLSRDPKRALAERFKVDVPPDVRVQVLADTLHEVHAVIPEEEGLHGDERGVIAELLRRFRSDPQFRRLVLEEPKQAFAQHTKITLPDRPKVRAVLETQNRRYIHLPPLEARTVSSLPEAQALWGGGGEEWDWGGTYETGGVCTCLTEYDLSSSLPQCCRGPEETEGPEGSSGGGGPRS